MQQVNSNETPSSRPWLLPLLSSLLLSFTVCLFAPLETYYATVAELWWPVTFILPALLLLFVGVFGVLFGLGMLFRGTLRNLLCTGYVGLALMVFLQGNFLNADYGVFNGINIDWDSYGYYGRWNALVWLLVILVPMVCVLIQKKLVGAVRFLCVLLTVMQVFSVTTLALTTDAPTQARKYVFTTDGEFELSKGNNTVVFVIDTLCPTYLNDYLSTHPQQVQLLEGFTQFTNFVGLFRNTDYALPAMLTSCIYDFSTNYNNFWKEAWTKSELLSTFQQNGYRSFVYTNLKYAYGTAAEYVENAQEQGLVVSSEQDFAREYAQLTAFRYLPHGLKKHFVGDFAFVTDGYRVQGKEVFNLGKDELFIKQVADGVLSASIDEPTFHFYHLRGAHIPYLLSSDGVKRGDKTSITEVMDAYFGMLEDYFNQMKALGVYEDATIVITADHGDHRLDPAPIMLVKRPGGAGALVNDDSLVSQQSFAATIADAAGLEGTFNTDISAFDAHAAKEVQTPYYSYNLKTQEFHEYRVIPDSLGDKCYIPTFKAYTTHGVVDTQANVYELGTWAGMTNIEYAEEWMDHISQPRTNGNDGVWLGTGINRVQIRIEQPPTGKLEVCFGIFAVNGESQRMQLRDNNGILAQTVLNPGDTEAKFVIDASAMQGDLLSLRLVFPDAINLSDITMAVAVNGFMISELQ